MLNAYRSSPTRRCAGPLAMAIDQEAFGQALFSGECVASDQVFGEGWFAHNPDIDADYIPFDPEGARQILEAEGVTDLEFTAITANIPSFVAMDEAIQAFLADVGIHHERGSHSDSGAYLRVHHQQDCRCLLVAESRRR